MDLRLKTPKKYRPAQQRRHFGSMRWLRNLILIGVFSYAAYLIYLNQTSFRERVLDVGGDGLNQVRNMIPPTATPVIDVANELVEAERAYRVGEYETAVVNYRQVITGQPNNLEAHYRLAYLLIITSNLGSNQARLEEALEVGEKAINANPEAPDGWAIRGMALAWLERNSEAIAYAERALELDPNYVIANAIIAQAYMQANRPEESVAEIDKAIQHLTQVGSASPETISIVFRVQGFILSQQVQREEAITAYRRALDATPNESYIAAELAYEYQGNDQITEAIGLLRSRLDSNAQDTQILFQLGSMYMNIGERTEAADQFQRCIEVDPENAACLSWLGGVRFYADPPQYNDAIQLLERAIAAGSTDPSDWWQLGRSYYWTGACDQAIPVLREGYPVAIENPVREGVYEGSTASFVDALRDCGATLTP